MLRFIPVILIFISTTLAADEQTDIQNTISNQLEAFASDDFTEAFTHASPGIKEILEQWFANYKGNEKMKSNGFRNLEEAEHILKEASGQFEKAESKK